MNNLQIMRYYKQFIWLKIEKDIATLGITDYAQNKWGEIVYTELPFLGKFCKQGEIFGAIETSRSINHLAMPLDGLVLKINTKLSVEPTIINIDPLGEGWLLQMKIMDVIQIESLLTEKVYHQIISSSN